MSIFNWFYGQNADICFFQETHSTEEVQFQWKKQWKGEYFFSHGTNHSKAVLIYVRESLDFILKGQ